MLGIFAVFVLFGTLDFTPVFAAAPNMAGKTIDFLGWHPDALTLDEAVAALAAKASGATPGAISLGDHPDGGAVLRVGFGPSLPVGADALASLADAPQ